ncbi:ATPase AAA-type core domain-containing protein [Fusobacterium sp. oral taxon C10]
MLLEFRVKNYKSFKEELIFSLTPVLKEEKLKYSILKEKIGEKEYDGLSTSVIYGPNASGKSNIIGAMDTFKKIILRGNIHNSQNRETSNIAAEMLELIPNNGLIEKSPISFFIKFIEKELLIEYNFSIDIGGFLESADYERKIIEESLKINNFEIYNRKNDLKIKEINRIKDYLVNDFKENEDGITTIAKNNLNSEELFLMNGFKTMFSSKLVAIISEWLNNKFIIIYRADFLQANYTGNNVVDNVENEINKVAEEFGRGSNELKYYRNEKSQRVMLYSILEKNKKRIPAELFESYGTIRFINIFPFILKIFLNGGILVADEFDASIHPMALINIINIFHNNDINKNQAQLVFNTHNPIFLNGNLFREDEIKFVEKNDKNMSISYSLSDFERNEDSEDYEDYMNNYFVDHYGAIKDIDFTPIFENLMKNKKEG